MTSTAEMKPVEAGTHAPGVHVVPVRTLILVWAALMIFTVLTVAVTYVDWGRLNIWIALLIALVKATLVGLYFMHLRWDNPFYAVVLVGALLFVVLFISLALIDTQTYQPDFEPPRSVARPA